MVVQYVQVAPCEADLLDVHPSSSATALAPGAFRHPTRSLWPAAIDVYAMHGYLILQGGTIGIYCITLL